MSEYEQLKLGNQVCFPLYAASRLITREYQPFLDKIGITYPQYLVLMVLWETDGMAVNDIADRLILNTNTITPLLKRMEAQGIVTRTRSGSDERKVIVHLARKGRAMQTKAAPVPEKLMKSIVTEGMTVQKLTELRDKVNVLVKVLSDKTNKMA
jgi:MarR family transcriptional regulator, organic hydroperoxide resistance regulator